MDQEAVDQTVEETTPIESAPIENETTEAQSEPAEASFVPEKKVSESVPLDRFNEVIQERNQYRDLISRLAPPQQAEQTVPNTWYDEEGIKPELLERTIDMRAKAQTREALVDYEAQKFASKHGNELLSDPVLKATVIDLEREELSSRGYVDYDTLKKRAEDLIEGRTTPKVNQARIEGEKEGQSIAKAQAKANTVGTTGKAPVLDFSKMSAADLKQYYIENNIPIQ